MVNDWAAEVTTVPGYTYMNVALLGLNKGGTNHMTLAN